MKIKILKSFVTIEGLSYAVKQECEVDEKTAKKFVDSGLAEYVEQEIIETEKPKRNTRKKEIDV